MDGHDPDLFAAAVTFAFNFRVAAVKPSDEFLQAAAMLLFKLQGTSDSLKSALDGLTNSQKNN